MTTTSTAAERIVVRTSLLEKDAVGALLDVVPPESPVSWIRRREGLVGWGVAAEVRTSGPTRFSDAAKWWSEMVARADIRDEVNEPGTGPVSFGSFGFADDPGDSVLVLPRVVVGRRGDLAWVTTVDCEIPDLAPAEPARAPVVSFADGARNGDEWMSVVADAVSRINRGDLEKVVLARDLIATSDVDVDVRWPLRQLSETYPMCWTFHVDGLFGATPEMLVRRERGLVTSRVLAGTIRRTGDDERDLALAATLARSSKDLEEHEYAVRSVAEALEPHCSSMNVPEAPFVLHLPNVMHLATDVAGVVHDAESVSSLDLAEALHPSAAVGGTPTDVATDLIAEIEGMDRARYAGPVGWIDATGDGEWGIALRSAHVAGPTVRLFAGCGIVGDSDPEAELAESQAKFVPVRDALTASR
ncbi:MULTISPECIES: isochorismate synthase MenF [unclassified Nocardioides]|uniref:isochorismate synthase n=1 Tax=unclassified Nocardioides TaxID=2615069 RepID=UPI0006FE7871|nr:MULTISPECIES: isochorismate synthase [unclassified Nocardioides]KQY56915.1 isochorismate synthase [Nocardioides sp. Root140]KQZ66888.1 isochorismate synthase [Nocardioides sp. Root151]KRF13037.1 isochorismate synthase [Nocardioides sp. Soil796]